MIPIIPISDLNSNYKEENSPDSYSIIGLNNPIPLSLYIHIPWCVSKCPYCDFNSHESKGTMPEDDYVNALIVDLEQSTPLIWGRKIHSVFFGGGTPSLFSTQSIDRILSHVRMLTSLEYGAEITLEANPGTFEAANFSGYRDSGVNRLSIGIQSFNDNYLKSLGRIHDRNQAISAIESALTIFEKVNLDIMYGLPHQTIDDALMDARIATGFNPQHLSFYHLTLEPNTSFYHNPPKLPDDDTTSLMQDEIESCLIEHGYEHYETSAFAKPKMECKHNLNYWNFGDYLGIGAGAHSKLSFHDKIIRQSRHKHPKRYIENSFIQKSVDNEWIIYKKDLTFEFMMNALRLTKGFESSLYSERTGLMFESLENLTNVASSRGLLEIDNKTIKPSQLGQRYLNDLLQLFLDD